MYIFHVPGNVVSFLWIICPFLPATFMMVSLILCPPPPTPLYWDMTSTECAIGRGWETRAMFSLLLCPLIMDYGTSYSHFLLRNIFLMIFTFSYLPPTGRWTPEWPPFMLVILPIYSDHHEGLLPLSPILLPLTNHSHSTAHNSNRSNGSRSWTLSFQWGMGTGPREDSNDPQLHRWVKAT